ncbi:MAG TPA: fused MFS/spermidine synthase [Mariprofundaceae bacterium]|nr:fused MFS/spermidine synthase [Mariprofundaceae bacterium]
MINWPRGILLLVYGGTGVTALAYEVLWTRMLSLMFGISIFGVVLTVTAFMAGLGAGSMLGARLYGRYDSRQALLLLAALEAAIALYALILPVCMPWLDQLLLAAGAGMPLAKWQALQALSALLLLMPAALAMGFAFPMALRAAESLSLSLSSMYGINAVGGAIGALLPLLLLPLLGWRTGLWGVAGLGLFLSGLAVVLASHVKKASAQEAGTNTGLPPWLDLLAYAGIGAAALMFEIIWTREYGMVLLRTEYILAVLLLVYLTGIGLGSLIARKLKPNPWLSILPVGAAVLALGGQYLLPGISQWANQAEFGSLLQAMVEEGGLVLLCTLPVTLALGAWLPLLASRFDSGSRTTGIVSGGWLYGANSLGAAMGSMLAGFVLLPWVGTAGAMIIASVLLLVCGMRWAGKRRALWLSLPLLLLFAWPVRFLPAASDMLPSLQSGTDMSVYEDAVALTHVVEQADGQRLLLSDLQRMDASTDPTAVTVQKNQARLPLLLHPHPQSLLLLGLGTGITAAGSLPYAELDRTAIELSQGAIDAARVAFSQVNGHVTENMRIVHDDARRFLRSERRKYDVIIGDLFHPDMVGRANLLSLQQFSRARSRLNDGGIFVQWLALNQFDIDSLKVVMQTFRQAFATGGRPDNAMLFVDGYRVALVGMHGDVSSAEEMMRKLGRMSDAELNDATGGEGFWTWLGRYWGPIPDFSAEGVKLQDEWAPVIEFSLPKVRYRGMNAIGMWRWLLSWRQAMNQADHIWKIRSDDLDSFHRAWVSASLDVHLWMAELAGDEEQVVKWARLSHRANKLDRWPAFALADRMFDSLEHGAPAGLNRKQALEQILALRPDHEGAVRAMFHLMQATGDVRAAEVWREKLRALSPLAIDVRER